MKRKLQTRRSLLKRASLATLAGLAGRTGQLLAADDPASGMRRIGGEVSVNGSPARVGMSVLPGDTVTTGTASEAIYVIGRDAHLQRANSRVAFGDSAAAGLLRVVTGRLLSVFGPGARRLDTPTATIGIRGTGCYIEAEVERVYFCLCYGEAEVTPTAAPEQRLTIRVGHHEKPLYISRDMTAPQLALPAAMLNHHDDELVMLEALVGRRPPFERTGSY